MLVKVNNEIRTYNVTPTLGEVIGIKMTRGVAVALNGRIIRRENWESTYLNDGDDILIINAAYGG